MIVQSQFLVTGAFIFCNIRHDIQFGDDLAGLFA